MGRGEDFGLGYPFTVPVTRLPYRVVRPRQKQKYTKTPMDGWESKQASKG